MCAEPRVQGQRTEGVADSVDEVALLAVSVDEVDSRVDMEEEVVVVAAAEASRPTLLPTHPIRLLTLRLLAAKQARPSMSVT